MCTGDLSDRCAPGTCQGKERPSGGTQKRSKLQVCIEPVTIIRIDLVIIIGIELVTILRMDLLTIIKMDPDKWSISTKNESLGSEIFHHPYVAGGVA